MLPKILVFASLILILILEISRGGLKGFVAYFRGVSWRPFWILLSGAFLAVLLAMPFDMALNQILRAHDSEFKRVVIVQFFGFFGKYFGSWPILIGLYLAAFVARRQDLQRIFFACIAGSSFTSLFAHILKHIFYRARPYKELGPYVFFNFKGFLEDDRAFQSFPSGDVAVVAGATSVMFLAFKNSFVRWPLLFFPLGTALARICANKHWPSDTLFSIGLSLIVAKFIWDFEKAKTFQPTLP